MPERRHLRREVVAESLSRESCEAQCLLGPLKGRTALRIPKSNVGSPGRAHQLARCFLIGGVIEALAFSGAEHQSEERWRFPLWLLPVRGQPKDLEARERRNLLTGFTKQTAVGEAPLKVGSLDDTVDQRFAINEHINRSRSPCLRSSFKDLGQASAEPA